MLAALHDVTRSLEQAMLTAGVREQPDLAAVNTFLIDAYRNHWAAGH